MSKMVGKCTRIEKIEIENFKNVKAILAKW